MDSRFGVKRRANNPALSKYLIQVPIKIKPLTRFNGNKNMEIETLLEL